MKSMERHQQAVQQVNADLDRWFPEKYDDRFEPEVIRRNQRCVCRRPRKFKRCCGLEMAD